MNSPGIVLSIAACLWVILFIFVEYGDHIDPPNHHVYLKVRVQLVDGGAGYVSEEGVHGHHHAGGAEPALGPVAVGQPLRENDS